MDYFRPNNHRRPRIRDFYTILWKNYEANKIRKKELFNNVEKVKILDWFLNKVINMGNLSSFQKKMLLRYRKSVDSKVIYALNDCYFPLHDYNYLDESINTEFFSQLFLKKGGYRESKEVRNQVDKKLDSSTKNISNENLNIKESKVNRPKRSSIIPN